jgi:hypothetical protein
MVINEVTFPTVSEQMDVKPVETCARFFLSLSTVSFFERVLPFFQAFYMTVKMHFLDLYYLCLSV